MENLKKELQKGNIVEMSKKEKKNNINSNQNQISLKGKIEQLSDKIDAQNRTKTLSRVDRIIAIIVGVVTIIGAIVRVIWNYSRMNSGIDGLQTDVATLQKDSSQMYKYLYEDGGVKDQLGDINGRLTNIESQLTDIADALNLNVIRVANNETSAMIDGASIEKNDKDYVTTSIPSESQIGVDANGKVYIAKDLINETVILTYMEDSKEVYFLGQYNENYHWNGYCVTNVYNSDGTLAGICESNFDDGKRLDYISFYSDTENEWIYTNRKHTDGKNIGTTVNYQLDDNSVKNFTNTNVRITDILYADKYIVKSAPAMTKYYKGSTKDGVYHDSTGNAYEIKYNDDGTVKMLYMGQFENGYCEDATGQAFAIVYSDKYNKYYCNTGIFTEGHTVTSSNTPITVDEIKEIVSKYSFDYELKWVQVEQNNEDATSKL